MESVEKNAEFENSSEETESMGSSLVSGAFGESANRRVRPLGFLSIKNDLFSEVYVEIAQYHDIPDIRVAIVIGRIADKEGRDVYDSQEIQNEIATIFDENLPDFEYATGYYYDSPLTLFSGQIQLETLKEEFPIPENVQDTVSLKDHRPFIKEIREGLISEKFGIYRKGMISVETDFHRHLSLIGQSVWTSSGNQIKHNGYSILEFMTKEHPLVHGNLDHTTPFNISLGMRYPDRYAYNIIPIFFYFYWFREQVSFEKPMLIQNLHEIPIEVTESEDIDEFIDILKTEEREFYENYILFLERLDAAETYLDNLSNSTFGNNEIGIPLASEQRPPGHTPAEGMETKFDFELGVVNSLISDTRKVMVEAEHEYDKLFNRYEIALEELSQQIDLILAQQSHELNKSNVELQRDVQQLTKYVAVLTLILVYFGILDLILRTSVIRPEFQPYLILVLTAIVILLWLGVSERVSSNE